MNTKPSKERIYEVDGEYLTKSELGLALYHISRNTRVSRDYTLKFVSDALLRASEMLLNDEPASVLEYGEESNESLSETIERDYFVDVHTKPIKQTTYCEYHDTEHEGLNAHTCPAQEGKVCGCCNAGRQQCMKRKFEEVDVWQRDKLYTNNENISTK